MTPGEQLACEWEARHDVAARARRSGDVAPVQHYLSHVRCSEHAHAPQRPAEQVARDEQERRQAAGSAALRQWLRWGEDDGRSVPPGRRAGDLG
jgi:hypothetical protein